MLPSWLTRMNLAQARQSIQLSWTGQYIKCVQSIQLSWTGQYKKCVQYASPFNLVGRDITKSVYSTSSSLLQFTVQTHEGAGHHNIGTAQCSVYSAAQHNVVCTVQFEAYFKSVWDRNLNWVDLIRNFKQSRFYF